MFKYDQRNWFISLRGNEASVLVVLKICCEQLIALALETSSLGKLFIRQLDLQATVTLETLKTSSLDQLFTLALETSSLGKLFMLAFGALQARSLGDCNS